MFATRDPVTGSLHDARADDAAGDDRPMEWLVSGGDPIPVAPPPDLVRLFGDAEDPEVEAARVPVRNSSDRVEGNLAWWTGDLGVRANISTQDPRAELAFGKDGGTDESWYRLMLSQAPDIERMNGGGTATTTPNGLDSHAEQATDTVLGLVVEHVHKLQDEAGQRRVRRRGTEHGIPRHDSMVTGSRSGRDHRQRQHP